MPWHAQGKSAEPVDSAHIGCIEWHLDLLASPKSVESKLVVSWSHGSI